MNVWWETGSRLKIQDKEKKLEKLKLEEMNPAKIESEAAEILQKRKSSKLNEQNKAHDTSDSSISMSCSNISPIMYIHLF